MMDRRKAIGFIGIGVAGVVMLPGCREAASSKSPAAQPPMKTYDFAPLADQIKALEAREGGRLGVGLHDTGTGARFAARGDERFAMCSTFKMPLSALVLKQAERGKLKMSDAMPIKQNDIIPNSPITEKHVGGTLTLAELCHATMTTSDNAAANLLLSRVGGEQGFTTFMRSLGDQVTRLDRVEPDLNLGTPGDPRDTTSPNAMLATMEKLLLGNALSVPSRETLTGWMVANTTGNKAIRAGTPAGWRVGDKTGAGDYGTRNDIAILWPPEKPPLLLTLYYTETDKTLEQSTAVLAEATRLVLAEVSRV